MGMTTVLLLTKSPRQRLLAHHVSGKKKPVTKRHYAWTQVCFA
jgi:hypothetical protein